MRASVSRRQHWAHAQPAAAWYVFFLWPTEHSSDRWRQPPFSDDEEHKKRRSQWNWDEKNVLWWVRKKQHNVADENHRWRTSNIVKWLSTCDDAEWFSFRQWLDSVVMMAWLHSLSHLQSDEGMIQSHSNEWNGSTKSDCEKKRVSGKKNLFICRKSNIKFLIESLPAWLMGSAGPRRSLHQICAKNGRDGERIKVKIVTFDLPRMATWVWEVERSK